MKSKRTKYIILIGGLTIMSIIAISSITSLPYFLQFRNTNFSSNSQDWGSYGSFISGIVSILNLTIFIMLTVYIAKLGDTNSENQVKTQKRIIISQFRQTEINKLNEILDSIHDIKDDENKYEMVRIFQSISTCLTNFLNQKTVLFPILKDKNVDINIKNLLEKYNEFSLIIKANYGKSENELEPGTIENMTTKLQALLFKKNEVIESLQQFVLDDLEN